MTEHLFVWPGGLLPAPKGGYWELLICEAHIRYHQRKGTVMTTKEMAIEIATRFLDKHAQREAPDD